MSDVKEVFEVRITDVYDYCFSYGGQSVFFKELSEKNRFTGSRCPNCGFVWCPPRITCSRCLTVTQVVELPNEGELIASLSLSAAPASVSQLGMPVHVGLVRLDGTDTCFKTIVLARESRLAKGSRVEARFLEKIETIADFYFVLSGAS